MPSILCCQTRLWAQQVQCIVASPLPVGHAHQLLRGGSAKVAVAVHAEYPISRVSSGEQLRVQLVDKSGDTTGELSMTVDTGGYGSTPLCSVLYLR